MIDLLFSRAGRLWIGTYDGGLSRLKNGRFSNFTTVDRLFSNNVFCILKDANGWFWMNSNQCIYRVTATDGSGNSSSCSFTVSVFYNFSGFQSPIGAGLNPVKAGSSVAVKFSLSGGKGLDILAAGYPTSLPIACAGAEPNGEEIPTVTAGRSSLTYDALTDIYTYVWKTEKSWSGCRRLAFKLADGSTRTADFRFR